MQRIAFLCVANNALFAFLRKMTILYFFLDNALKRSACRGHGGNTSIQKICYNMDMLNNPEMFEDFLKVFDKHYQTELINSESPDFSKLDPNRINKINERNCLNIIEQFINQCKINGDFQQYEQELKEHTNKYLNEKFPVSIPTVSNILKGYQMNQFSCLFNPALASFVLYVELLRTLYFYIQQKYIRKITDNLDIEFIHTFIQYSLELLTGINSLLLDNNQNSVISIYRTFYENYIVFIYLQNHKDLREKFLEHTNFDSILIQIENLKLKKQEIPEELESQKQSYIDKYGTSFKEDYGWASSVIPGKGKLKVMYDESNLGDVFNYYYKLSCKYTHVTGISLSSRPDFKGVIGFLLAISEIMINEFKVLFEYVPFKNNKEKVLLRNWVNVSSMNLDSVIKDALNYL